MHLPRSHARRCSVAVLSLAVASMAFASTMSIGAAAAGTPILSVGDASVAEGNTGAARNASVNVSLSEAATTTVTVQYALVDWSATAGSDYRALTTPTKTLTFQPGQVTKTVVVAVLADTVSEGDEAFAVVLSNPTGPAVIGDPNGTVTIVDDEGAGLAMSAGDVALYEGDTKTRPAVFWVTLTDPAPATVTVNVTTKQISAKAGVDYKTTTKALVFNAGQFKKSVSVVTYGDAADGVDEEFHVLLTNAVGAAVSDDRGVGSIVDNDALAVNPGPSGLYLGVQSGITVTVDPKASPSRTWGSAPPIDANYGGTLYAGTDIEQTDPRPALVGGEEPLRMWVARPDTTSTDRPAIVWVHGGGFAYGIDSTSGLANGVGKEYAQRGYVSFAMEYRIDTTIIHNGSDRAALCQWVQDNVDPEDPVWVARRDQCSRNIYTAHYDIQAAVRYVREHAAEWGVDPGRIAVGGFSAGAVTAMNSAYRGEQVGTETYFDGDDRSVAASRVPAAFGASGCLPTADFGPPTDIDAADAPTSFIASKYDVAVDYPCVADTVTVARSIPLVAELTSYCDSSLHAGNLRDAHKAETDALWTTFLAREMSLYSGMAAATQDPVCP